MKKLAFLLISSFCLSAGIATAQSKGDTVLYEGWQDANHSKYSPENLSNSGNPLSHSIRNQKFLTSQNLEDMTIDVGHGTYFNYNAAEGIGTFFDKTTRQLITQTSGYPTTWDRIVYLGNDLLLSYDAEAGQGEIYLVNQRRGEIYRLKKYIDFRRTWDKIYSDEPGEVTLVDINGETETYFVEPDGVMEED